MRNPTLVDAIEIVIDCRDPQDDRFLELAVSGKVSHRRSGARDLLLSHPFRGIRDGTAQESAGQCWTNPARSGNCGPSSAVPKPPGMRVRTGRFTEIPGPAKRVFRERDAFTSPMVLW